MSNIQESNSDQIGQQSEVVDDIKIVKMTRIQLDHLAAPFLTASKAFNGETIYNGPVHFDTKNRRIECITPVKRDMPKETTQFLVSPLNHGNFILNSKSDGGMIEINHKGRLYQSNRSIFMFDDQSEIKNAALEIWQEKTDAWQPTSGTLLRRAIDKSYREKRPSGLRYVRKQIQHLMQELEVLTVGMNQNLQWNQFFMEGYFVPFMQDQKIQLSYRELKALEDAISINFVHGTEQEIKESRATFSQKMYEDYFNYVKSRSTSVAKYLQSTINELFRQWREDEDCGEQNANCAFLGRVMTIAGPILEQEKNLRSLEKTLKAIIDTLIP